MEILPSTLLSKLRTVSLKTVPSSPLELSLLFFEKLKTGFAFSIEQVIFFTSFELSIQT